MTALRSNRGGLMSSDVDDRNIGTEVEQWPSGTASQLCELTSILRNLGLLQGTIATTPTQSGHFSDLQLANLAKFVWSTRRIRTKVMGPDIFGEPAWDIMLDLFYRQVQNQAVFVKGACLSADAPTTTALRWIDALADRAWISRSADPADKRRQTIHLTETGLNKVRECLNGIARLLGEFRMDETGIEPIAVQERD